MLFHFLVGEGLMQTLNGAWSDVRKPRKDDYAMGEPKSEGTGIRYCVLSYSVECLHELYTLVAR